jgi:hypothetical protein
VGSSTLFVRLFRYSSGDNRAAENFLTEAFAHTLQTDKGLARRFICRCLRDDSIVPDSIHSVKIETQSTRRFGGTRVFPDMAIRCETAGGKLVEILSEHKWRSPVNRDQLLCYSDLPCAGGVRQVVAFIGSSDERCCEAKPHCTTALTWTDVHDLVDAQSTQHPLSVEFKSFLREQGLAQVALPEVQLELNRLLGIYVARRLANEFEWSALPPRFRNDPDLQGPGKRGFRKRRAGIDFGGSSYPPALWAGLMLPNSDLGLGILNNVTGLDLGVLLSARPPDEMPSHELESVARTLKEQFPDADVLCGHETGNGWFKLAVRQSLLELVPDPNADDATTTRIFERLHAWCHCMFSDGALLRTLERMWPASGWC